jgi:copper chaperone CopZ
VAKQSTGDPMTSDHGSIRIVSFPIEGMTCASCVNRITRSLRTVPGVQAVKVNLATESATVRLDHTVTDVASLAAAVEAAGYVARTDRIETSAATVAQPTVVDGRLARIRGRLTDAARRARHARPVRSADTAAHNRPL